MDWGFLLLFSVNKIKLKLYKSPLFALLKDPKMWFILDYPPRLHLEKMEGHFSNYTFTQFYDKRNQVNLFV
jgi:hypothetical protein